MEDPGEQMLTYRLEDFMLCKAENRDPEHCLKEGRRVTRCAIDLCVCSIAACVSASFSSLTWLPLTKPQDHEDARELRYGVRAALELS